MMLYNWRVVETPKNDDSGGYGRYWCYQGHDPAPAIAAVYAWQITDGCSAATQPVGWIKNWRGDRPRTVGARERA
jgi:hypothetical protein